MLKQFRSGRSGIFVDLERPVEKVGCVGGYVTWQHGRREFSNLNLYQQLPQLLAGGGETDLEHCLKLIELRPGVCTRQHLHNQTSDTPDIGL